MTYTDSFFFLAALAAAAGYIAVARRPENGGFQFFNKGAFFACTAANGLIATPFMLNHYQFANGYSSTFILMMVAAVALLVGLAVYNVRKTRPLFGLASTAAQVAVYGIAFPVLLAYLGYQLFFGALSGAAGSDGYDRVADPDERFGVSDDELRGEGLFDHDRVNG